MLDKLILNMTSSENKDFTVLSLLCSDRNTNKIYSSLIIKYCSNVDKSKCVIWVLYAYYGTLACQGVLLILD